MSVILNALRSKEAANKGKQVSMPKQGIYVDTIKDEGLSSRSRVAILLAILCSVSVFSFMRLSSEFLLDSSAVKIAMKEDQLPADNVKIASAAALVEKENKEQEIDVRKELDTAKELFAKNKLDASLAIYERLIKKDPKNAMMLNDMGFVLFKQNRVLEAESRFKAAAQINPKCAECFNNLGMLSTQIGRLDEAEEFLMRSIKINPDYPDAHFNLAVLLQKAGDIMTARAHFEDFLNLTPHKSAPVALQVRQFLSSTKAQEVDEDAENT